MYGSCFRKVIRPRVRERASFRDITALRNCNHVHSHLQIDRGVHRAARWASYALLMTNQTARTDVVMDVLDIIRGSSSPHSGSAESSTSRRPRTSYRVILSSDTKCHANKRIQRRTARCAAYRYIVLRAAAGVSESRSGRAAPAPAPYHCTC